MTEFTAIEITSPKIAEILTCLSPLFGYLNYDEDLHLNFVVFNYPIAGEWQLVKATDMKHWSSIMPGMKCKLVQVTE
jgi:hypothetical protein